ncbi:polysaccharide deacetylase family protein [Compostimonas suwonensis]|uniref:Polysaccharide deacetylase n=1 Tax=Compostimonas suwonensis TaxID=1048394 RepID=A0A2M9BUY8_9MICO|nr:polysaccharide deacetylase [Compostimonas suwonensis]PJJ61702.1 polysaccharide deacetylase [Compostimonas suwonensis]
MPITMPEGTTTAVAITIDFDAHSPWMGGFGLTSPSVLSRGEFGAEVGVPRLLSLFERLDIPTTWCTPGHDLVTFPDRVESVMAAGHEIAAHGAYHEDLRSLDEERERELMVLQLEQHLAITGLKPRGYRSPAWDFSAATMGILEEFGFEWDSSLMGREFEPYHPRPVTLAYESANTFGAPSPVLELPVSWYLDDWPAVEYIPGVSPQMGSHRVMLQRWKDIFEYARTRVDNALYTLTVHPQTIGRAHHIAGFEELLTEMRGHDDVWFATLSEIYDAYTDD